MLRVGGGAGAAAHAAVVGDGEGDHGRMTLMKGAGKCGVLVQPASLGSTKGFLSWIGIALELVETRPDTSESKRLAGSQTGAFAGARTSVLWWRRAFCTCSGKRQDPKKGIKKGLQMARSRSRDFVRPVTASFQTRPPVPLWTR